MYINNTLVLPTKCSQFSNPFFFKLLKITTCTRTECLCGALISSVLKKKLESPSGLPLVRLSIPTYKLKMNDFMWQPRKIFSQWFFVS